jgi:PAS domain S-box-containing protein
MDFVSDYVERMLGYSVEEWLATPNFWLSIVHPDDKEEAVRSAGETFASKKAGTNRFRWIAKDGRVIWVESQSVAVCDESGNPVGMRGVTMDISERRKKEADQQFLPKPARRSLPRSITKPRFQRSLILPSRILRLVRR